VVSFNSIVSALARVALTGALVGFALISQTGFASATVTCDVSWKNPGTSGSWTNNMNWNGDTLPTSADNVCLPASGTLYTVSVEGSGNAKALVVSSGATLQVKGSGGTATVTTAGDLVNEVGGTVFIGQASAHNVATIVVGGTFLNGGSFTTGQDHNHLDADVTNQSGGTFTVATGSKLINGKTDSLFQNDGTLSVNGQFDILTNNTFTMNVGSSVSGTAMLHVVGGSVHHNGGTITGNLTAENVLLYPESTNGAGTIRVVNQHNFLQANVSANDTVIVDGGFAGSDGVLGSSESRVNGGTIKLSSSSASAPLRTAILDFYFTKTLTNNGTIQTMQGTGSASTPHRGLWANLINAGTLQIDYDTDNFRTMALTQSSGTTSLTAQLDVTGTIADPRFVLNGGTINGSGTLKGKLQNNGGTVAPGNSPGTLTINGAFEQAAGGTLAIEIGGTTAGTDNDRLHVTFPATLGGTLALSRLNGFSPGPAFSYDYLLYDVGASGTFANVTGTDAGNGRTFVNTLGGPKATLTVTGGPSVTRKPDGKIALGKVTNPFAGDNVYNLDGTNQTKSKSVIAGKTATFFIRIQNDGTGASDSFKIKATGSSVTGYTFKCFKGTTKITTAVNNGTYLISQVAVGAQFTIKCKVGVLSTAAHGSSVSRLLTITSNNDGTAKDAVKLTVSRP